MNISKEETIKRLKEARFTVQPYLYMNEAFDVAIEAISNERPKGRWVRTSEEKPNSTRHIIYADGGLISHYGYYLQPKDKWYTNWKCEEEITEPAMWTEMPEVPKESILGECGR